MVHGARSRRLIAALVTLLPVAAVTVSAMTVHARRRASPHGTYKEECGLCHAAGAWKPARISPKFDHARFGFALAGAHAAAGCTSCHTSLDFKQARAQCQSCHQDPHRGELGVDCARCHGSRSFLERGPMLRAHQLTRFPLTGGHAVLDCETCHPPAAQGQLRFVNTRAECQSCHIDDYRAAPNHAAGAFSLDCQTCHSTLTWSRARFDHARTSFPLTGAHRSVACERCHGDGVYDGKSGDCASCHMPDYDGAQPDHRAAGFDPARCATCHTTNGWSGADFNHDGNWFPIYSGAHRGRWSDCTDCHSSSTDFSQFTCITCHPHSDRTTTDGHHAAVSGYQYDSRSCYSCHPRGTH